MEETAAFDSKDSFALRVKYDKHVVSEHACAVSGALLTCAFYSFWQLFIPVEPSTSYETLVGRALGMLANSDASPPEDSSLAAFDGMQPDDVALFSGSTGVAGGAAAHDATIRFVELDRASQSTVAKMGLHDGAEAVVYLGFRSKVKGE